MKLEDMVDVTAGPMTLTQITSEILFLDLLYSPLHAIYSVKPKGNGEYYLLAYIDRESFLKGGTNETTR
jgi:hypothetical protein